MRSEVQTPHKTHTHAHIHCRPIQTHNGGRGTLDTLPFLNIENCDEECSWRWIMSRPNAERMWASEHRKSVHRFMCPNIQNGVQSLIAVHFVNNWSRAWPWKEWFIHRYETSSGMPRCIFSNHPYVRTDIKNIYVYLFLRQVSMGGLGLWIRGRFSSNGKSVNWTKPCMYGSACEDRCPCVNKPVCF